MGYWSELVENIFSTKIIIKGKENIIKNEKFFIASSPINVWDFLFANNFNSPIFILKNELLKNPIFGWYLKNWIYIS